MFLNCVTLPSIPTHTHTLFIYSTMKEKHSMRQIVLPQVLSVEQVACAEEVAHELGLKTEKV